MLPAPTERPQVLQTIVVIPDGRFQPQQSATAAARVRVVGCEQPAQLSFTTAQVTALRSYVWGVTKTATSQINIKTPYSSAVTISYEVRFDRAPASVGGYAVDTAVEVANPNYFQLSLGFVQLEVRQLGLQPAYVRAKCPTDANGRVIIPARDAVACTVSWAAPGVPTGAVTVRSQAFYIDGTRVDGPLTRLDWADVAISEAGRCALISDTFSRTSADPLAEPSTIDGNVAPPMGQERRICNPAVFRYTATWGPWRRTDCTLTQP